MKLSPKNKNRSDLSILLAVVVLASPQALLAESIQGDTIQGNLFVTDTGVFSNGIDLGVSGESSLYWSNALSTTVSDIFNAQGSFLWRDSVTSNPTVSFTEKMRLDNTNNLTLYKTDGLAGVVINPADGKVTISNNGANSGIFFGANATATLKAASNGSAIFPNSVTLQSTSGTLGIAGTTAATSSTTGALTVAGGIGAGKDSVFNGVRIGRGNGNVHTNTALGGSALNSNTTGYGNSATGVNALYYNTTGYYNSATGSGALCSNTEGYSNSAFGTSALYANTTGSNNSASGLCSLRWNTTGNYNTANGTNALFSNSTGANNSATGFSALLKNTTGNFNVAIGYAAGSYQEDGSTPLTDPVASIYIGANARGYDNDDDNAIVIGASAIGMGANTTVIGNTYTTRTHLHGETTTDSLRVSGNVIIEQPQGDISMGIYQ